MERHTEDPLPLDDLAQKVSLSRRQVERLFEKHLGTTPHKYYLLLRLQKAKQ
ncbi:helix-turn-helix domain-containing protein, partial [Raoultella ornithinolytica]|uniref:helix-turn-helix domain-containing protein n=1 Tax=Raoultella ornithinolytica TaxID=54291 RepID=UPI001D1142CB